MLTGPTMKAATEEHDHDDHVHHHDHDGNGTGNEYASPKPRPRHDTRPTNPPEGDPVLWFLARDSRLVARASPVGGRSPAVLESG